MGHRFSYSMPVRFADTDAQGHMYFANYLTFCDEALAAYMRAIGCPWQDMVKGGVDMFYAHAECDYRGSATFEEALELAVTIRRFGNSSVHSSFDVLDGEGALIANAELVSVCIDPETKRPVRVPAMLRDAVARYEATDDGAPDGT